MKVNIIKVIRLQNPIHILYYAVHLFHVVRVFFLCLFGLILCHV